MLESIKFLSLSFILSLIFSSSAYCKVYLITAATSGLGTSISQNLANQGDTLILTGRNEEKLKDLVKSLNTSHGQKHHAVHFDYENFDTITQVISDLGNIKIDGLVIIPPQSEIPNKAILNGAEWNKLLQINFTAPMELINRLHHHFQKPSSVVVISELSSVMYSPEYGNSAIPRTMWKAAVKNLSHQLAHHHVRVNLISPGVILTDNQVKKIETRAKQHKTTYEKQVQKEVKDIPSARYGEPSDVTELVNFLLSNKSTYVNGSNIVLDGGQSKSY